MAACFGQAWDHRRIYVGDPGDAFRPVAYFLRHVARRAFAQTFFRHPCPVAHPVAVESAVHGFCEFLGRDFSDFQISAYDVHRHTFGLYNCLFRGHGFTLFPAQAKEGLQLPVFSAVSVFGDLSMFGHDDLSGAGNLVASDNLAGHRIDYLFYVQQV